jgi:hypothetical protein
LFSSPGEPEGEPHDRTAAIDWITIHAVGSEARLRSMAAGRGSMEGFRGW